MDENNRYVTVADVDIPFGRLVMLFITWTLAAIPALIVVWFALGLIIMLVMGLFGGFGGVGMRGWMTR